MRNTKILQFLICFLVPSHYLFYLKQMEVKHIETSKYNYWIIPLEVGLDKSLKPQDKLLYAQLLSLSKQRGYCFATNYYLSKLNNDVCKRTIINSLYNLKKNNYIKVEIDRKENNNSKRKIFIVNQNVFKNNSSSIDKNYNTSKEKYYIHNKDNSKKNNLINSIISYDTDGVMLWHGVRCESKECSKEEQEELNAILAEFKGDANE